MDGRRYAFRFGALRPLLSLLGMGPSVSSLELTAERLRVRMGWAFRAELPRAAIRSCTPSPGPVGGIGVHGWRGRWLVNGATSGLVELTFEPAQRALVLGVPVKLTFLRVSLADPDALVAELGNR